jgi:glycosyltransferase involved in cell wall biosynthesis
VSNLGLAADITFTGAAGQDRVKTLYRSADIFILPSFAEGLPVVLMEAMAMEIPVISTYIAGIPELIDSGETGFLVPPGNVDMLVEKINLLLEQPPVRMQVGKKGREKVAAHYNLVKNCRTLAEIFKMELKKK